MLNAEWGQENEYKHAQSASSINRRGSVLRSGIGTLPIESSGGHCSCAPLLQNTLKQAGFLAKPRWHHAWSVRAAGRPTMTRDTNRFARTSGTRPIVTAIAGTVGVAALLATVGCGARDPQALSAQTLAAPVAQAGAPIVVSCEPNQRTLVRPVVVNGATVSQVECITNGAVPIATQPFAAAAADPYRQPRALQPAVYDRGDDLAEARVIPVSQPTTVARPIQARQVVYSDLPVRKTRIGEEERDHHWFVGWRRCRRRGGHRRQEGRAHRRRDRRRRGGALGSAHAARSVVVLSRSLHREDRRGRGTHLMVLCGPRRSQR